MAERSVVSHSDSGVPRSKTCTKQCSRSRASEHVCCKHAQSGACSSRLHQCNLSVINTTQTNVLISAWSCSSGGCEHDDRYIMLGRTMKGGYTKPLGLCTAPSLLSQWKCLAGSVVLRAWLLYRSISRSKSFRLPKNLQQKQRLARCMQDEQWCIGALMCAVACAHVA